jgi:hypothetical protein
MSVTSCMAVLAGGTASCIAFPDIHPPFVAS